MKPIEGFMKNKSLDGSVCSNNSQINYCKLNEDCEGVSEATQRSQQDQAE